MIVTYTPGEGERREWDFRQANMSSGEAEDIEEALGVSFSEWETNLHFGYAKPRRALLWILLKRDQPDINFADLRDYRMGDMTVEYTREEEDRLLAELEKSKDFSAEDVANVRRALGRDEEGGAPADGEVGKGRSTRGSPTGTSG